MKNDLHWPWILYRILKKVTKVILWIVTTIILLTALYFILSVMLSVIPVNRKAHPNHEAEMYIISNGVHLDIALPVKNEIKDWTSEGWMDIPVNYPAHFISFGWGDKIFFINTPQWSDLTFQTAFRALFLESPSALHVDYYETMPLGKWCKKIPVSGEQYRKVTGYIERSFRRDSSGNPILISGLHYYGYDCFFEATGSYNLFFTCNTWTNKCLKQAGLKASLWTPFDRGTLYHYRK